jgi:limonene 1,2-monooxygenase
MTLPLRHGLFVPPLHQVRDNPTLSLERDMELIELADRLGFKEAWIGEHHSIGWEIISSPELFIAAAAERTRHIRLGTGVVSLPYHNPLMVANRIIQLDHMTRGRVMFGVGPGLLPSDARMLGIDPTATRDRMAEALDVIMRLFRGEVVTERSEWYNLVEARTHLMPYTSPYPEVCVASAATPSGGRLAGKYDLGMLCLIASHPQGFDALDVNWEVANQVAAERGMTMDRSRLRLVIIPHIAETREQAARDVRFGSREWVEYANLSVAAFDIPKDEDPVEWFVKQPGWIVGTPDDVIERIERLQAKQGDFGAVLLWTHDWADWEATKRSLELYARYVIPHFSNVNANREASVKWVEQRSPELVAQFRAGTEKMFAKHEAEWAEKRNSQM